MSGQTNKTKETWYDDCVALYDAGELAQAVSELKKLIEIYPDYGLARLALGVYAQKKGDEQLAIESMQKACEVDSNDPFYFTAFSAVAIKCGNHELAESALMKAQEARFAAQMKKMSELRKQELEAQKAKDSEEAQTAQDVEINEN